MRASYWFLSWNRGIHSTLPPIYSFKIYFNVILPSASKFLLARVWAVQPEIFSWLSLVPSSTLLDIFLFLPKCLLPNYLQLIIHHSSHILRSIISDELDFALNISKPDSRSNFISLDARYILESPISSLPPNRRTENAELPCRDEGSQGLK
jgi:hypothetical protein